MKISKVNHTAPAVAKVKEQPSKIKIAGILYDNPEKNNKNNTDDLSVEERVIQFNQKAQVLYSILNANEEYEFAQNPNEKKFCKYACSNFGKLVAALALAGDLEKQKAILSNLPNKTIVINSKGKCMKSENLSVVFDHKSISLERQKQLLSDLTIANARCSFRKTIYIEKEDGTETAISLQKVVAKLLWAMCHVKGNYSQLYQEISDIEITTLLNHLNRDYGKQTQIENIVKSIEHQNVKVQPKEIQCGNERIIKLQLANAEHKRKQYLFKFIKEFASGDEQRKNEMFIYIRKMIILFYCGKETYKHLTEEEVTPDGFHTNKVAKEECYSSELQTLLQEKDEKKDNKLKTKEINQRIKEFVKEKIHESYKQGRDLFKEKLDENKITQDEYEQHTYWLSYIADKARQLYGKKVIAKRLSTEFLCEYTWNEWLSFICMKYVDMGKAVYHFAMPDFTKMKKQELVIGKVQPWYEEGLTSFDYERIKAYDNLGRELAMYITFAVNNFARAVMTDEKRLEDQFEDVLSIRFDYLKGNLREDAVRRILQFFGGWSQCSKNIQNIDKQDFFKAIVEELKIVRNGSFHYTGDFQESKQNEIVRQLFEEEFSKVDSVFRKKYLSNNVLMFYEEQNVKEVLNQLYSRPVERAAQIPAFGKIVKRSDFGEFVNGYLKEHKLEAEISTDDMKKFRSALYFILKEVYYYDFLQNEKLKKKFIDNLQKYNTETVRKREDLKKKKETNHTLKKKYREIEDECRAISNFKERIDQICKNKKITFGEICQQIMTDYNLQNNREIKVEVRKMNSGKKGKEVEGKIYQHFRMLLYKGIREIFEDYLKEKESIYGFLAKPVNHIEKYADLSETDICSGWKCGLYDGVMECWEQNPEMMAWYTMAHFLNQRQLNLLIGVFRSHMQYITDIDKRSKLVGNYQEMGTQEKVQHYKNILSVLEFTMLFCERMTNEVTDYFASNEEYAIHVGKYVSFEKEWLDAEAALKKFCEQTEENSPNGKIGIYYDAQNPVLNKNVVKAMLYGDAKLLESCVEPIQEQEIRTYYSNRKELSEVFKSGVCKDEKEQRKLKQFQNQKNRIELTNVAIYMEMIDDLMSHLISWAYIRERDLMYFQLGYWYTKLYHGDSIPMEDGKRRIYEKKFKIAEGAILYQITAMYHMNLPMYEFNEQGKATIKVGKGNGTIGTRVKSFMNIYGEDVYKEGLQLFEKPEDHEEVVKYRNYLDHFKYFSKLDRSILDLYSVMFDRFFDYSSMLYRSVSVVLKNILAAYFVTANATIKSETSLDFEGKERYGNHIRLERYESACFTYKVGKGVEIEARNDIFLMELQRILEFSKD